MLVVATSLCCPQISCVERRNPVRRRLSSSNSASMSSGLTTSLLLSASRLMRGYIADGMESSSANLPSPLGDFVRHGEELVAVLVQQEMIIAEVRVRSYASENSWFSGTA